MTRTRKSERSVSSSSHSSSSSDESNSSSSQSSLKKEVSRQKLLISSLQRELEESKKDKETEVNKVYDLFNSICTRYVDLNKIFEEKVEKNKVLFEEKKDHRESHKRMQAKITQLNFEFNEKEHSGSRRNDYSFYEKQLRKAFDLLERTLLYSMTQVDYWKKTSQDKVMKLDVENYQLSKDILASKLDVINSVNRIESLKKQTIVAETKQTFAEKTTSKIQTKLETLQKRYQG